MDLAPPSPPLAPLNIAHTPRARATSPWTPTTIASTSTHYRRRRAKSPRTWAVVSGAEGKLCDSHDEAMVYVNEKGFGWVEKFADPAEAKQYMDDLIAAWDPNPEGWDLQWDNVESAMRAQSNLESRLEQTSLEKQAIQKREREREKKRLRVESSAGPSSGAGSPAVSIRALGGTFKPPERGKSPNAMSRKTNEGGSGSGVEGGRARAFDGDGGGAGAGAVSSKTVRVGTSGIRGIEGVDGPRATDASEPRSRPGDMSMLRSNSTGGGSSGKAVRPPPHREAPVPAPSASVPAPAPAPAQEEAAVVRTVTLIPPRPANSATTTASTTPAGGTARPAAPPRPRPLPGSSADTSIAIDDSSPETFKKPIPLPGSSAAASISIDHSPETLTKTIDATWLED